MPGTLEALNLAVNATPDDRTVRLVYADALEETGEAAHAARAAFIRAQIEAESLSELDPRRLELMTAAQSLFHQHWLEWWRPVCRAAGLPEPHVPGSRPRVPAPSHSRRPRRWRNWPYTSSAADTSVHALAYGMSVRFAGGFPEEVEFVNLDEPEHAPKLVHRWAAAMPVVRVVFVHPLTVSEWKRVDGPHFSRVPEFVFHHLPAETTVRVAASPHLANLARLSICPIGPVTDAIRAVVHSPSWTRLRKLRVTTILSPAGMQELARQCNLNKLEDLELTVGNAADPFASLGAIGEILSHVIHLVASSLTVRPVRGLNWPEYGPAFETFAATKWVRKLRRLRIASSRGIGTLAIPLFNRPPRRAPDADFLPDRALLALSDSLNRKRLEKLLLPLSVVSAEVRGRLSRRFGSRVEFE